MRLVQKSKANFFITQLFSFFIVAVLPSCASTSTTERRISSDLLIPWSTAESKDLFERADKTDFYPLAANFESQVNKFYCGPASAVVVLNALRLRKEGAQLPKDPSLYRGTLRTLPANYDPVFDRYSQDAFFNAQTDKVKTMKQVFGEKMPGGKDKALIADYGIQLQQYADMLKTYNLKVETRIVGDDANTDSIKGEIIQNLKQEGNYVLVNYARSALGQKGGGHISPLAAYDDRSDAVLIMDVNSSHQPWVWVRLDDLIKAMKTYDTVSNRGYLLLSEI